METTSQPNTTAPSSTSHRSELVNAQTTSTSQMTVTTPQSQSTEEEQPCEPNNASLPATSYKDGYLTIDGTGHRYKVVTMENGTFSKFRQQCKDKEMTFRLHLVDLGPESAAALYTEAFSKLGKDFISSAPYKRPKFEL